MLMSSRGTSSFTARHVFIDAQHQTWFEYADACFNSTSKELRTLRAIQFYQLTREHFAAEEQLMDDTQYPDRQTHALKHQAVIASLNDISDGLTEGSLNLAQAHAFVVKWMLTHIEQDDALFEAHMHKHGYLHSEN